MAKNDVISTKLEDIHSTLKEIKEDMKLFRGTQVEHSNFISGQKIINLILGAVGGGALTMVISVITGLIK